MEILEAVVESAQIQADIAAVWLYGSRARGDHHEGSDYYT